MKTLSNADTIGESTRAATRARYRHIAGRTTVSMALTLLATAAGFVSGYAMGGADTAWACGAHASTHAAGPSSSGAPYGKTRKPCTHDPVIDRYRPNCY